MISCSSFANQRKFDHYSEILMLSVIILFLQNFTVNGNRFNMANIKSTEGPSLTAPKPGCQGGVICTQTTCANNAMCIDYWTFTECRCKPGYSGANCSIQKIASFNGKNLLHFSGQQSITEVLFWISATRPQGIIYYTVCFTSFL